MRPASPARSQEEERSVHSLSDQNLRLPWMRWMPLRVSCTCLGIYSFEPFISRAARTLCPFAAGWPFLLLFLSFTRAPGPSLSLWLRAPLSRSLYLAIALSLFVSIASSLSGLLRRILPAANLLPSAKIRAGTINFCGILGDSPPIFFYFTRNFAFLRVTAGAETTAVLVLLCTCKQLPRKWTFFCLPFSSRISYLFILALFVYEM